MAPNRIFLGGADFGGSAMGTHRNANLSPGPVGSDFTRLNAWLGRESGKPVHIITPEADLTAELKRGLSSIRREKHV